MSRELNAVCAKITVAFALMGPCSAVAESKVQYVYDALGRLIAIDERIPGMGGYTTRYGLDAASNRTTVATEKIVETGILASGASLPLGTGIVSPNSQYRLTLKQDGNLVLYEAATNPIWYTRTFNSANAELNMQLDGNLVLYEGGQYVWSSQTFNNPGAYLAVLSDGNIVIYDTNNSPIWARFGL